MKVTHLLMAGAAAMSLSACAAMDTDGDGMADTTTAAADMTPENGMAYVAMSGSSDLFEIESSRLHHTQGQNRELHAYAQRMIDHHTQLSAQTMAAARAAGMSPPPPTLMPMHQQMIDRLRPLRGAAFDREYRRLQETSHEMALRLQQNYANDGDTPQLRSNAQAATPIVQGHLTEIRNIRI